MDQVLTICVNGTGEWSVGFGLVPPSLNCAAEPGREMGLATATS